MNLAQEAKVVNLLPAKDISTSAHTAAYVSMENYDHVTLILNFGAVGAIGSSVAVTLKKAKTTTPSSATSLPVIQYWKNAAALASASIANDTYTKTAVASSAATFKLTPSTDYQVYIIEKDAASLGDGYKAIGVGVAATAAATICGALAILTRARYQGASPPSAL